VPLAHINRYRDRHGKLRLYFRRPGGKNFVLPGEPGSAEFMAAYNAALGYLRTSYYCSRARTHNMADCGRSGLPGNR